MVRTYFRSQDELAHAWAHQTAPEGRCGGSMSFRGPVLNSYYATIGILYRPMRARRKDPPVVLETSERYSVTTSSHMSIMRRASSHLESHYVCLARVDRHEDATPVRFFAWTRELTRGIDSARAELFRGSVLNVRYRRDSIRERCQSLAKFLHTFRGELDLRKYPDADVPHSGTYVHRPDSPLYGKPDGTPREWIAYARLLIKTEGFPGIGDRAHLARKLARLETRDMGIRRRDRHSVARELWYRWRPCFRALRAGNDADARAVLPGLAGADYRPPYNGEGDGYVYSCPSIPSERFRNRYGDRVFAIVRDSAKAKWAERKRIARMERAERERIARENLAGWLRGENPAGGTAVFGILGSEAYARISRDGRELETSLGARVPIDHARRLARFITRDSDLTRAAIVGAKVGHFTVSDFDRETWNLRIGCHNFNGEEVKRICGILAGIPATMDGGTDA